MSVLSVTGLLRTISGATYSSECSTYSGESQKSGSWANRPGLRDLLSEQPTNLYIFFADGVLDDFFVWVDVQVDDVGRMKAVQAFEDFFEVHGDLVQLQITFMFVVTSHCSSTKFAFRLLHQHCSFDAVARLFEVE